MDADLFSDHLENPQGLGLLERASHRGSAGGAACGDVVDFRVECSADGTLEVGFDCVGCNYTFPGAHTSRGYLRVRCSVSYFKAPPLVS